MTFSSSRRALPAKMAIVFLSVVPMCAAAQTQQANPAAAEATKVAAEKPTPRAADGHPDLTGYWDFPGPPKSAYQDADGTIYVFHPPSGPNRGRAPSQPAPPYKPELLPKIRDLAENEVHEDPGFHCKPLGVPRVGPPRQIVQTAKLVILFYQVDLGEGDATGVGVRLIPTDGRPHRTDVDPMYFGDSIGHWEGDTLAVDVTHLTDDTWLGIAGWIHSTGLHVMERYTRKGDTLTYEATVEDPKVLTKPWTLVPQTVVLGNDMVYEQPPCEEKEEQHIVNKVHHPADF